MNNKILLVDGMGNPIETKPKIEKVLFDKDTKFPKGFIDTIMPNLDSKIVLDKGLLVRVVYQNITKRRFTCEIIGYLKKEE
jgi:hypothetical protein